MPRFTLINTTDNSLVEIRNFDQQPPNPAGKPRKWLPIVVDQPAIDPLTEIGTGISYSVGALNVTETFGKRALTAQEISDQKDFVIGAFAATGYSPVGKLLQNMNNRLRALEGQAALTPAQFRAFWRGLL